jgi:hypothetical protein
MTKARPETFSSRYSLTLETVGRGCNSIRFKGSFNIVEVMFEILTLPLYAFLVDLRLDPLNACFPQLNPPLSKSRPARVDLPHAFLADNRDLYCLRTEFQSTVVETRVFHVRREAKSPRLQMANELSDTPRHATPKVRVIAISGAAERHMNPTSSPRTARRHGQNLSSHAISVERRPATERSYRMAHDVRTPYSRAPSIQEPCAVPMMADKIHPHAKVNARTVAAPPRSPRRKMMADINSP